MPRHHSVSHYHSHPFIKQSPTSNMPTLPLQHSTRISPLKSRPATPLHSQHLACQPIKPSPSIPHQSCRSKSKSAANSTGPKRLPKSRNESQLAALSQSNPPASASIQPHNKKSLSKRSRKPRDGTLSPSAADPIVAPLYNLSFPESHPFSIDSPDRGINSSPTPRISEASTNHHALSLTDFCDQLTAEAYNHSFEVNHAGRPRMSQKKSGNRRSKKDRQRCAPVCSTLSDSEDVLTFDHSIFHSHESLSRSATPTPINTLESPPTLDDPPSAHHDGKIAVSTATTVLGPLSLKAAHHAASSPRRQHVRAKSVASIFDFEKPELPFKPRGAKDDWDMPPPATSQGLTWQQKKKKAEKPPSSSFTPTHPLPKLVHHEPRSLPSTVLVSKPKDTSARRHRTTIARTSSANTLSRPSVPTTKVTPSSTSRSDDESALTWQQSILRPSPRHTLPTCRSDHPSTNPETKSCNKKNSTLTGSKTPVKVAGNPRKAEATFAVHTRTGGPPPSLNKRRNSLSSPRPTTLKPLENTPISEKSRPLGSQSGENIFPEWKSFAISHVSGKSAPPIFPSPLPISGAQGDSNTPNRRHAKSYTHQPSISLMQPTIHSSNQLPVSSHIKDMKVKTPSKTRSTSEDLYLATPVNKLSTPALRAAFMYAGPQFHNSPCPAALPAPKFSLGSA
ncbi:hypothetical protein VP01_572g3 [Puccinia sorghi]|uniref:Uncharacterized protein n=1 Tax=Puccinia sorghi TaxID=27349 RepID=A0A0L6UKN9_9BASI|nr:hypothetical protein VP01_572g3 [Puccinia sorghi]